MRRAIVISLLGLLMATARALPRQQPTGVIEGTVVRSDTGKPIQGVYVGLSGPSAQQSVTTETGADGKFSFKSLNAGTYRVLATRSGFVRHEYAQRNLNGWGGPIVLSASQTFKDAVLRMTPTGTVTGRILDENGRPATGAPVQLLRVAYNIYGKTHQPSAHGVANNLGNFRIEGVVPGRYFVLAGTPAGSRWFSQPPWFNLVYFPSSSSIERASMIDVMPDVETLVDMQVPQSGPSRRVKGRIVDSTGFGWPTNPEIILTDGTWDGTITFSAERSINRTTSTFDLQDVPTGNYTLHVTGNTVGTIRIDPLIAALEPAGIVPIQVIDTDLEDVVVTLTRGVTVNGRISVEGQPVSVIPNLQEMRFGLGTVNGVPFHRAPQTTNMSSDGRFRISGLREGAEYRANFIGPIPPGSGLYLKSIRFNGDDVLSKPLKFSGSAARELEIILGTGGLGQIAGNVTDAQSGAVPGALVVALPMERGRITDYRTTSTDQNGRYTLGNLTPGDYQLFSWESIQDDAFYDPGFMKEYEQHGKAVHVANASSQAVDVRAIPAP